MVPKRMRWGRMNSEIRAAIELLRAISVGPRWAILRILAEGEKGTGEIMEELALKFGMPVPKSLLYYHLDFLEKVGLVEVAGYRETGKGGAPEKVWRLRSRQIVIDLKSGRVEVE